MTEVCDDAIGGDFPTVVGCEDLYVGMVLCTSNLAANPWECSDQGPNVFWPAPVAGTGCETAACAWSCCDYRGGGVLFDAGFVGARCNSCP